MLKQLTKLGETAQLGENSLYACHYERPLHIILIHIIQIILLIL